MGSFYAVYTMHVREIPTHDRSDPSILLTTLAKWRIGQWILMLVVYLYPWVIIFMVVSSAGILILTIDALDSKFEFSLLLCEILKYCAYHVCSIIVLITLPPVPIWTLIGLSILLILLSIVIGLLCALYLFLMDSSRNFGDSYEYIIL